MDANEDYLDSLLNAVMSQDTGGKDSGLGGTQQNSGSEAELEEINDLLKKSDQNQMPDADMLAMLEREESEAPEGGSDNDIPDVFDIFSSESVEPEENEIAETPEPASETAGEALTNRGQQAEDSEFNGETYLDALLNGTGVDGGAAGAEEQPENAHVDSEDMISLDSLQSEEEQPPQEDYAGGEDDLLSLDSLQSEEEQPPQEDYAGGEDDLLSLDSLQSDELMSYGGMSEDDGASTEEDEAIQREIDELLGLAGVSDDEESESSHDEHVLDSTLPTAAPEEENTSGSKKKKSKKEKKRFGKKSKEAADVPLGSDGEEGGTDGAFDDMSDDRELSLSAGENGTADTGKAKAKGKKEKVKKQKKEAAMGQENGSLEKEPKGPGFFSKLLNTLFEETEEEDEDQLQEMEVSDENREVIATVENEKIENKKSKSKKAKKGKKGKEGAKQEADGEDDEEAPVDEKKAAKEKKKREKKEKKEQKARERKEKEEEEKAVPKKKLPRGKVFSIFAFCFTLLAVIVILCFILPQQQDLKKAREAYYEQDYLTVYQNLQGKDLSDSDYILYMRSRMILNMRGKLDNYLVYMGMDKEMAALNELMLAVHYYQSNRALAEGYGALAEMDTIYTQILSVLEQQYQIDEQEAIDIFALDDLSYNERLYYLVYGTEFVAPGVSKNGMPGGMNQAADEGGIENAGSDLPDALPEENEMIGDDPFQENGGVSGEMSNPAAAQNANADVPENNADASVGADSSDQGVQNGSDSNAADQGMQGGSDGNAADQEMQGDTNGNVPGESLSQGDGEVLYSGEVQNGNVVLQ